MIEDLGVSSLRRIVLLAMAWFSLGGCKLDSDRKYADPERDIALLERTVRLPLRPIEVWFRSVPRGTGGGIGPNDWTFLAVMRFDPDALAKFVREGHLVEKPDPRLPRHELVSWFPAEVKTALLPATDTHLRVKGRRFDAIPFARGAPATPGSFFILDDAPFVILRRPQE